MKGWMRGRWYSTVAALLIWSLCECVCLCVPQDVYVLVHVCVCMLSFVGVRMDAYGFYRGGVIVSSFAAFLSPISSNPLRGWGEIISRKPHIWYFSGLLDPGSKGIPNRELKKGFNTQICNLETKSLDLGFGSVYAFIWRSRRKTKTGSLQMLYRRFTDAYHPLFATLLI